MLIIAELYEGSECIARWTDRDGPPNLAAMLPSLIDSGWTVHDLRQEAAREH